MADDSFPHDEETQRKRAQARERQRALRERRAGAKKTDEASAAGVAIGGDRGNVVVPGYSERRVKTYTLFESELLTLTVLDGFAGLALSVTFAAGSFYFGANWDLLLAADLPQSVIAEAQASRTTALCVGSIFLALAAAAVFWRVLVANDIRKNSTPHVFRSHTEIQ